MGYVTTHVLDTAQGRPGAGIHISLYQIRDQRTLVKTLETNSDGRTDQPVLTDSEFTAGTFELVFNVKDYFSNSTLTLPETPFLDEIPLRFTLTEDDHYHVPLLVSPWSYSTYRGS